MSVRTIIGLLGVVLSILGGLWYWQIQQTVATFYAPGNPPSHETHGISNLAIALICLGIALAIGSVVACLLASDEKD